MCSLESCGGGVGGSDECSDGDVHRAAPKCVFRPAMSMQLPDYSHECWEGVSAAGRVRLDFASAKRRVAK